MINDMPNVSVDDVTGSTVSPDVRSWWNKEMPWGGETHAKAHKRCRLVGLSEEIADKTKKAFDAAGGPDQPRPYIAFQYEAVSEYPPEKTADMEQVVSDLSGVPTWVADEDKDFVHQCQTAVAHKKLPKRAPIDRELTWVMANLDRKRPDLQTCPSLPAVTLVRWARLNETIRKQLILTYVSKRMGAGSPVGSKGKAAAFQEDSQDKEARTAEDQDKELFERLFSKGPPGDAE